MKQIAALLVVACMSLAVTACHRGDSPEDQAAQPMEKETPLAKSYPKLVFQAFDADPQVNSDNPGAVSECESNAMAAVIAKNIFASVEKEKPGAKYSHALLLKGKVVSMRIVSTGARIWLGAMAGGSDMTVHLTLTDADTGEVVREKLLSSANNAWGAAWSSGSSDRSLPADTGRIVGEYMAAVMPSASAAPAAAPAPTKE